MSTEPIMQESAKGFGWIKVHRELQESARFKDSEWVHVWLFILLNATHKQIKMVFGATVVELKPGQLITSRKSISEKTGIHESKIERVLKWMEIEQQIEQQSSAISRLITVVKWGSYQQIEQVIEQQSNNARTTLEQQSNTNKKVKNEKKEKNNPDEVLIPEALKTEKFLAAWPKWLSHLAEKRTRPTTHAKELQLRKCLAIGPDRATAMIEHSITNNWQGLFESKDGQFSGAPKTPAGKQPSIFDCL